MVVVKDEAVVESGEMQMRQLRCQCQWPGDLESPAECGLCNFFATRSHLSGRRPGVGPSIVAQLVIGCSG